MVLLKTALMDFKKNIAMNILTMLEMITTIIIMIVMLSSFLLRYEYYKPFKDVFRSNGIYCDFVARANTQLEAPSLKTFLSDEDIFPYLHSPENIIACNSIMGLTVYDENSQEYINVDNRAYNDEYIKRYSPKLKAGRWLNTSDKATEIEAVVSKNDYGWKTGDKIKVSFFNLPEQLITEITIVGELENGIKIGGGSTIHDNSPNYNLMFSTYDFEIEDRKPLLLFSSQYVKNFDAPIDIVLGLYNGVLITYPDSVTEEELIEDKKTLSTLGSAYSETLSVMEKNNWEYLNEQLYNLLPVIIVILILTFISSISNTALSTYRRLHDYAVYYINGLQWKHCIIINLIQSLIISIISAIIGLSSMLFVKFTPFSNNISIVWSSWSFVAVLALIAVYLCISMIMPIIIIGKSTPKQILTR